MVVIETINQAEILRIFGGLFLATVVIFWAIALFTRALKTRPSKYYRVLLGDLYVSAKIKQLASKDSLDLSKEFDSFKSFMKKQRIGNQKIDETIEEEIQEKISEDFSKGKVKDLDIFRLNKVSKSKK